MKLAHSVFSKPIYFAENQIQLLIIESPSLYRQLVFELINQSEGQKGEFILSFNGDPLDCAEHLHIIYDFFHLAPEGKKLLNKFQAQTQYLIKSQLSAQTSELEHNISRYLEQLQFICAPAAFEENDYISALLKGVKFGPTLEEGTHLERLISHINIYNSLITGQCFILIGAKAFFEPEELVRLYHWALGSKCRLLLLEACPSPLLKYEHPLILDRDMCEIYLDSYNEYTL